MPKGSGDPVIPQHMVCHEMEEILPQWAALHLFFSASCLPSVRWDLTEVNWSDVAACCPSAESDLLFLQ